MDDQTARQDWMGLMARAPAGRIAELLTHANIATQTEWVRQPEIGSVMVQGRTGGTGAPFNLGEITVTRCALRIPSGEVGHAYIQGRRKDDARAAALVDALMRTENAESMKRAILDPLRLEESARKQARAEKAAATKVEFFTMARGED